MLDTNIKYLRRKHKISQQELADALGLPRTTLGDYERGKTEPSIQMLIQISEYFNVKLDHLLKSNLSHQDLEIIRNRDMKILAISVDQDNKGNIELVDTKAEAGYLESFADPEYIRDLPKIAFPSIPEGTYRGFEIQGNSMLPMEPGSIVISSYVERLDELKDDQTYIIVSKSDGVVYKRVRNLRDSKSLFLQSDNESYLPYEISYDEVAEIWKYYAHLSFSDERSAINDLLEEKINDIQKKVAQMHNVVVK